jgi:hypothetical protein
MMIGSTDKEEGETVKAMTNLPRLGRWTIVGCVVLLVAACSPQGPQQTLEERAQARWDLLLERDFEGAWAYMTPGFRETTPAFDYAVDAARRPVRWLSAAVSGKECEEDVCKISVLVEYRAPGAPSGMSEIQLSRTIEETWIRLDGQWWFVQN